MVKTIADTTSGYRVLETSHPPVYYIPPDDIAQQYLRSSAGQFVVRIQGAREILVARRQRPDAPRTRPGAIRRHLPHLPTSRAIWRSTLPASIECWVDDERVQPQEGDFYGGWITSRIVGPFKGGAGTRGW